jgi:cyclohexanone monooxygenase
MRQRTLDSKAKRELKHGAADMYAKRAETFGGFEYDFLGPLSTVHSPEELLEIFEEFWAIGGFKLWNGSFFDIMQDEKVNDFVYRFWRDKVRARISDPAVAELLAPTVAPHPWGMKRPSLEQNYYDVFNQDNVRLVDIREAPIERVTANGVLTADGEEHPLDVLVLATGFDAVTGGLTAIEIRGTDGETLRDKWKRGVSAHLGSATHGFPNMLFVYGPQSPSGFANGPSAAELQGEHIVKMINFMQDNGHTRFESTNEADKAWRGHVDEIADTTLFPRADSWYMSANIPGQVRQLINYPGGMRVYLEKFTECANAGYAGFDVT